MRIRYKNFCILGLIPKCWELNKSTAFMKTIYSHSIRIFHGLWQRLCCFFVSRKSCSPCTVTAWQYLESSKKLIFLHMYISTLTLPILVSLFDLVSDCDIFDTISRETEKTLLFYYLLLVLWGHTCFYHIYHPPANFPRLFPSYPSLFSIIFKSRPFFLLCNYS